jgi:hypothetical protein
MCSLTRLYTMRQGLLTPPPRLRRVAEPTSRFAGTCFHGADRLSGQQP